MADSRVYLGRGLSFPITVPQGRAATVVNAHLLNQSIKIILDTPLGTRLFLPEFGSRLKELIFEQNDEVLHDLLRVFTYQALEKWETRIKILSVIPTSVDDRVDCEIQYRVLSSNEIDSFVYPFYREIKY